MGTKHTSCGPKGAKRRRKAVAALRSFPGGSGPPNHLSPESFKEKVVADAGEESLAAKGRDFAKRQDISAVRDFGCGSTDRIGGNEDDIVNPPTAEKTPDCPIGNADAMVKEDDELTIEVEATKEESVGGPVARSKSGVKIVEKAADQASADTQKVSDKGKRDLSEDQRRGGIGTLKQNQTQGFESLQVTGKRVIIQCLMAAQSCPWINKKSAARDKMGSAAPKPRARRGWKSSN